MWLIQANTLDADCGKGILNTCPVWKIIFKEKLFCFLFRYVHIQVNNFWNIILALYFSTNFIKSAPTVKIHNRKTSPKIYNSTWQVKWQEGKVQDFGGKTIKNYNHKIQLYYRIKLWDIFHGITTMNKYYVHKLKHNIMHQIF